MRGRVFVQIASYRDPELLPTLRDCLARAEVPEALRFGLCWQRDDTESLGELASDPRFRVVEVPWQEARGACWARHRIQELWDGEEYTLQLDSHHRFAEGWDRACIELLESLRRAGVEKPLLTAYAPAYEPGADPVGRGVEPLRLRFDRFAPQGPLMVRPESIPDAGRLERPLRARFVSAHFLFTVGSFCRDVPYDPELYFYGEEISLAVRAFTHGYDLYHPHRVMLWHEYSRAEKAKHWGDHPDWHLADGHSFARCRRLLGMEGENPDLGRFGLGKERSLRDYERFAGIRFALRSVTPETLANAEPPGGPHGIGEEEWEGRLVSQHEVTVALLDSELPCVDDIDFCYVGAHDADDVEIFRVNLSGEELRHFFGSLDLERDFSWYSAAPAARWTLWPHSESLGWLKKVTRPVLR